MRTHRNRYNPEVGPQPGRILSPYDVKTRHSESAWSNNTYLKLGTKEHLTLYVIRNSKIITTQFNYGR